ncbi:fungal-specific transcription factor domain-containing protein [Scheffersomyces amazonensis]|uniref:fungal-specific transcription factor domain-containing protein n=1 Tax=Scheffersomyces amazonensis TaxID=1078765 RepID=UPI00315DE426
MMASDKIRDSKRDYSRGGCRECKRRKIKCDESKPFCLQCSRLQKTCSYPKAGEKVLRVSKRYLEIHSGEPPAPSPPKPLTIQVYQGPDFQKRKGKVRSFRPLKDIEADASANAKVNKRSGAGSGAASPPLSTVPTSTTVTSTTVSVPTPPATTPSAHPATAISSIINQTTSIESSLTNSNSSSDLISTPFQGTDSMDTANSQPQSFISPTSSFIMYNDEDLNLLASDLNEIVNDMMFASNFDDANNNNSVTTDFQHIFNKKSNGISLSPLSTTDGGIPRHVPIESIKVKTLDERTYLAGFYNEFAQQILPFGAFDNERGIYSNPLRDVILSFASKEPYILAAVLAQGAITVYRRTKLQKDQLANGSYLSTCLKFLGPALSRNRDKMVKDDLVSNIERILVTVLLLTSSNAATTKQSWRPHLKGAKDIVLKATNSKIRSSKTLILCKLWFADFEILAGTSSHLGGTLKSDEELDLVINFNDPYELSVLREFGIFQDNGFNIMFGYRNEIAYLFRDLLKIFNRRRVLGTEFVADDSIEYLRLLSGFSSEYNIRFVQSADEIILRNDGVIPDLIDIINVNGKEIAISWMDICQQAYSLAGLITVLTTILHNPFDAPHVQDLNNKLIALIGFTEECENVSEQVLKYSLSMIQWPISVAAMNCVNKDQRRLVHNFFTTSAELGSGSAEVALKKIKHAWNVHDGGQDYHESGEEYEDVVAY